jgi:predicted nucleic acid-binding protein
MNVYVESNFVLEHALEQEDYDSSVKMIGLAANHQIRLIIPAFSLAESHQAMSGKEKARSRLGKDLRMHLSELSRSRPHREIPASFDALAAALIATAQFEREGVRRTVKALLQVSEIIPLDVSILQSAAATELEYGLSGQDSIVLASVLAHLKANTPAESCFLNRNSKDFHDPHILERLDAFRCKFFARFAPALAYILSRLKQA